ncbi:hypothetical protein FG386_001882 [Cryptosporidium ryanae]|uniref:uncharacterized protein n=1 Tax=Cryptosporidium ryanae TaxID=515981 RepID=UPI00351A670D|nr:hypothetical protein FG386_001882 [Cryptosporidium ryanae]
MEETLKKHISALYLLCPTIPPRVLSNDQWWEVIKEVGGLCHTIPLLGQNYKEKDSLSQIEYLIVQFIQSDPPLLAIRWLMSLYSLINRYIKLSVSKLSKELVYLIHKFTGIEIVDSINIESLLDSKFLKNGVIIDNNNYHNVNKYNQENTVYIGDYKDNPHINADYASSNSVLDLVELVSRDIQPNFVITSLYVLQTLLRLEIIETRKDIPNLYKSVPQLISHVDKRIRDASNEFLLTIVYLGVPGYSLGNSLTDSFFEGIKVLMELDDFVNIQRLIQAMMVIFKQYPKLVSVKRHEILKLIVNISSSIIGENNLHLYSKSVINDIIESLSHLLANTVFIEIRINKKNDDIFEGFEYITGICNIQFSTYGLGSYPVQGECFRIIISNSILVLFELYEDNYWNKENKLKIYTNYIKGIRDLILSNFQLNYIRKHITENLQWLTNNHWVFLWNKIIEKIILSFVLHIQENIEDKNNVWLQFKCFMSPFLKVSPGITIECIYNIMNNVKDIHLFWESDSEIRELMIKWIFKASFTESFEMHGSSYYSGCIIAKLIQYNGFKTQEGILNLIFDNLLTFNKIDFLSFPIDDDYSQALIHNSHFLIGLSNYTSNSSLLTILLEYIINYLTKLPDFNSFFNQKIFNDRLFILNDSLLVTNNILSNLLLIIGENSDTNKVLKENNNYLDNLFIIIDELNKNIIPFCKMIISNNNIENVTTILDSLIESSERYQLIKSDKESSTLNLFEDDKDNPIILLFKDFKQWVFILWNSLEFIKQFVKIKEYLLSLNSNCSVNKKQEINISFEHNTENTLRLEKYLVKSCFNIVNNLLPNIPRDWLSILPGSKLLDQYENKRNMSLLINSELMDIKIDKYNSSITSTTSISDFDSIQLLDQINITDEEKEYLDISKKLLRNKIDDVNYNYEITETHERFVFPFIGDSCCFSRYVHFSVLIMLIKQMVYKELNDNLFKYNNHPKFSVNSINMVILDLVSDPLTSFLDPKYPNEVFPLSECDESIIKNERSCNHLMRKLENNAFIYNNDIFTLLEYSIGTKNNNSLLISKFGLLESMKVITMYPCIINQDRIKSKRTNEMLFRIETSKLISNIIFEGTCDNNSSESLRITKLILKLLYFKTINNNSYWSNIISEYNYVRKENNKTNIVNLFPNYSDLSPTLYITSIKSIVNSPNDSSIISILSILFSTKFLINLLINKIEELLIIDNNNNIIMINSCYNTLTYIVSSILKYLFGDKSINSDKKDYLNNNRPKTMPPRIKSSIIRYYLINLLVYLLKYFHDRRDIFNYYNTFVKKISNVVYYINYINKNNIRTSEDNEIKLDLTLFFFVSVIEKINIGDELFKKNNFSFSNESLNLNIFFNNKSFLFDLKKDVLTHYKNNTSDDFVSLYFRIDKNKKVNSNKINENNVKMTENNKYINYIGEYLCFYSYEELCNTGIFNNIMEYINIYIKNMFNGNVNNVENNLINELIVVSFSLIYKTRIHEIPLLDYNKCIFLPFEFKYIFNGKDFLSNLYNFLLRVNCNLFGKACTNNVNELKYLNLPFLNLIVVLLINECFINNNLYILNLLSVENLKSLTIQEDKFSIMLSKWLVDKNADYLSVKLLNNYFQSVTVSELISFSFNTIIYNINKDINNYNDYSNLDRISEISKCLLDNNKKLSNMTSPLYIQLNPYFYYINFFSTINDCKLTENYKDFLYSNNFILLTKIIKKTFETIYSKLSNKKCQNNTNISEENFNLEFNFVKDYIYQSKKLSLLILNNRDNILKSDLNIQEINDIPINNDNLGELFVFIHNLTYFLIEETNIKGKVNKDYRVEFVLNEYMYIVRLMLKIMEYNDNIYFSKLNISSFISSVFNLFISIENNINTYNCSYILFMNTTEILIFLYNNLSDDNRKILWEVIVNVVYNNKRNTSVNFESPEIILIYNLISKTNHNAINNEIILSKNCINKLMSIYFNLMNYLISIKEYNNEALILFSHFSYFLVDKVHNFESEINKIEYFSTDNINKIITIILNQNYNLIYCIPSIIPIWNKLNKTKKYNKIIIDILVLLYSNSNKVCNITLNSLLFLLEIISSIDLSSKKNLNNANNIVNVPDIIHLNKLSNSINSVDNFKLMVIEYYKKLDSDNTYEDNSPFILIIYYFFLYTSEACFNSINLNEIEVYSKLYKLISDYYLTSIIENYNVDIKLEYIINTNKYLLQLFKRVVLFSNSDININLTIQNKIKNTLITLIINNSEYIINNNIQSNKKETTVSILLNSHLNWIENEIKSSIIDIGNDRGYLEYIDVLLDITFNILVFLYNIDINYKSENYKKSEKNVIKKCFMIFKYLLCSSSYVHPDYFTILINYLNNNATETEVNILPDFMLYREYHESLLNTILSKIEKYLDKVESKDYYLDLFNFLKISTLPFGFTYSIEYEFSSKNEKNIENSDYILEYPIKRCWNIINNMMNKNKVDSNTSCTLEEYIKNYKNKYLEIINNNEYSCIFSFKGISDYISSLNEFDVHSDVHILIPSAITLVWFLIVHENKMDIVKTNLKKNLINEENSDYEDNKMDDDNDKIIKWFRKNDFFLPTNEQSILIEFKF